MRPGVAEQEVGGPKRAAIDRPVPACLPRPARVQSPVLDERVPARDERIEDERPASPDERGETHVLVPDSGTSTTSVRCATCDHAATSAGQRRQARATRTRASTTPNPALASPARSTRFRG